MIKRKSIWRGMTALVLIMSLLIAFPRFSRSVHAIDFDRDMTLMITAGGGSDFEEDIAAADVVLDIYLIATAHPNPVQDIFDLTVLAPYDSVITLDEEIDNDGWHELAQLAAEIALKEGTPITTIAAGEKTAAMVPGLYLILAHGENLTEYVGSITDPSLNDKIVTIANSDMYEYAFAPELVTLPSKQDVNEDGMIMTSVEDGEWLYDIEGNMKPVRNLRFGSLEIVKTLRSFESSEEATFVFHVTGVNGEGKEVINERTGITMDHAGLESVVLDMIPVGAQITVVEEYTGSAYELTSQDGQQAVISAEETAQVSFENDYKAEERHGHGIVNTFTYDVENGWNWNGADSGSAEE